MQRKRERQTGEEKQHRSGKSIWAIVTGPQRKMPGVIYKQKHLQLNLVGSK